MAYVIYYNDREMNRLIANMDGVQDTLLAKAEEISVIARSLLDSKPKNRTGKAHIEVERIRNAEFGHIDWFVSMIDDTNERWPHGNAIAIEFGHHMGRIGTANRPYVDGLYIMTDTYALALGT